MTNILALLLSINGTLTQLNNQNALAATEPVGIILDEKEIYKNYAKKRAFEERVDYQLLGNTIACESKWNANAIGDNGKSVGIAQIHLPSHPYITKKQALDPYFSMEWMLVQWKAGNAHIWTCYRKLSIDY